MPTVVSALMDMNMSISFNANGGEGGTLPGIIYVDEITPQIIPAPSVENCGTRSGFTLDTTKWATSADGTEYVNGGETYSPDTSKTLYAVWTADAPAIVANPSVPATTDIYLKEESGQKQYSTDNKATWTTYTGNITVTGGSGTEKVIINSAGTFNITLDDANLNRICMDYVNYETFNLNLTLSGENTVYEEHDYAIYTSSGNITIDGDGSLEAKSDMRSGISAHSVTINSGTVKATGESDGIGINASTVTIADGMGYATSDSSMPEAGNTLSDGTDVKDSLQSQFVYIGAYTAPEPTVTVDSSNEIIYANGLPIIIANGADDGNTTIYYDENNNNVGDNEEAVAGATNEDLSAYYICGGSESTAVASTQITMTGGTVKEVYGGGNQSGATVTGSTNVTISGGTVSGNEYGGGVYGGGMLDNVANNTSVEIKGGTVKEVYGGGLFGDVTVSTNVTISGGTVNYVYGDKVNGNVTGSTSVTINGGTVTGYI